LADLFEPVSKFNEKIKTFGIDEERSIDFQLKEHQKTKNNTAESKKKLD